MVAYVARGAAVTVDTQTNGDQSQASSARLADGTLVVVWQSTVGDGGGLGIRMQHFSAIGEKIGGESGVNAFGSLDQSKAQVAALAGGGYVVTWETADSSQDGSGTAVKAQMFDASGAPVGSEFRANSLVTADQGSPSVAGLGDGSFVIAWQTKDTARDGAGWAIMGQRFDAGGTALGAEFKLNATAFGSQTSVDLAALANDGFVATWHTGTGNFLPIAGQVFNNDGTKAGGEFNATDSGAYSSVTGLTNGGFVVTWFVGGTDIAGQVFGADRAPVGARFWVGKGGLPDVAALADGGFVVDWQDYQGNRAQTYSAAGIAQGATILVSSEGGAGDEAAVVGLADGGFAAIWTGYSAGLDIRMQLFQPNAAPELGADARQIAVQENTIFVTSAVATDDGGPSPLSYAIVGGADAGLFRINAATGALSFAAASNYEAPSDNGVNNVYDVIVRASDGNLADTQAIAVTVSNANEGVIITSATSFTATENVTAVANLTANDLDGDAVVWSIAGGADAALFVIDPATGVLQFAAAQDYEAPADAGADHVYDLIVRASDGTLSSSKALTVTLAGANEAPVITSATALAVDENQTVAGTIVATDPEGAACTFAIVGGADSALFAIDPASGALRFVDAPDFEQPGDADGDNIYDVRVAAFDGANQADRDVAVTVNDVDEAPVFEPNASFTVFENGQGIALLNAADPEGASIAYSIAGGADAALFVIDAANGALRFVTAPDHEAPGDVGADNVYDVIVGASDGSLNSQQSLSVEVRNINEAPIIISAGGSSAAAGSVSENQRAVMTVQATDPDGTAPIYSIVGGADALRFTVDAATGVLSFVTAPDYEAPGDAGGDNVYNVLVSASDGSLSDQQSIAVTLINVVDGVTIDGTKQANTLTGTAAEDTIRGLAGNDTLYGLGGADWIDGGDGNDHIVGGAGADWMNGGAGSDTFVFTAIGDSAPTGVDLIADFTRSKDKVSLSGIDANSLISGDQSFAFIGTSQFGHVAGQLRYGVTNGAALVMGDTNGDGIADFIIQLGNTGTLSASDFLL